jgi:hypothetical protein
MTVFSAAFDFFIGSPAIRGSISPWMAADYPLDHRIAEAVRMSSCPVR